MRGALAAIAVVLGLVCPALAEVVPGPCVTEPAADSVVTARIDCGEVVLSVDPADPARGTVRLPFLRARGPGDASLPPMLMLSGGPGSSLLQPTTYGLLSDAFLGPILQQRDIVVLEERGGPHATPALNCEASSRLPWVVNQAGAGADAVALQAEALASCAAEARAAGIDLDLFNSVTMAADLEGARLAFGYDRWLVYGASYGTILAQHYLRDYPASVEALILDGADPLSTRSWGENWARSFAYAMANLADLCEADPKCAAAYDIPALLDAGIRLFDEGTIPVAGPADKGMPPITHDLTADEFASFVYQFANGQTEIRSLPAILSQMVAGGRDGVAAVMGPIVTQGILAARTPQPGGMAVLMHYAVVCSDDAVHSEAEVLIDPDTPEYAAIFGRSEARDYAASCKAVGVRELPPETDIDPLIDVPVLILAGRLDNRTPAFFAEKLAAEMPQVTLAEFPEGTHVQVGEINKCAASIMTAFAADPSASSDLSCIAAVPQRGFVLPDGSMSRNP